MEVAGGDRLCDGLRQGRRYRGDAEEVLHAADRDLAAAHELLGDHGELEDLRARLGELAGPAEGLRGAVEGVALLEHGLDGSGLLERGQLFPNDVL